MFCQEVSINSVSPNVNKGDKGAHMMSNTEDNRAQSDITGQKL